MIELIDNLIVRASIPVAVNGRLVRIGRDTVNGPKERMSAFEDSEAYLSEAARLLPCRNLGPCRVRDYLD